MGRRNHFSTAAIVAVIVISSPVRVDADTTSDIYKAYDIEDTTAIALQQQAVKSLVDSYNSKSQEYNYAVEYNSIMEKLDMESLTEQHAALSAEVLNLADNIKTNGIDMSYEEIQRSISKYRDKTRTLEELTMLIEKYSGVEEKEVPDYDFDALAQELVDAQDKLEEVKNNSDVGDVDNLYNFLQSSYTVKRKFDDTGLMLKSLPNTGVLSIFNGTVVYSDRDESTGETIKVDSGDGIIITYHDLTARYVQEGDTVTQYQKIATTGENLYVTLEINGAYYDLNELYGG